MDSKASGILAKASQDRLRGDYERALQRLSDGIRRDPGDVLLHKEAIDTALEAGESMRAVQLFKSALQKVPDAFQELWQFGRDKVEALNDPILCKCLLDVAVRKRDLEAAESVLQGLKDHTASDLLARTRNKSQTLSNASPIFKGEMTTNMLAEAMLCVRSNHFEDAATTFVRVLDDKPAEHEILTPYLTGLYRSQPKRGAIAYALACSCLQSADYARAFSMLVHGASLVEGSVDDAMRRVEALRGSADVPDEEIEFTLSQLLIVKKDTHVAAGILSKLLEKNHRRALAILELLEPYVELVGDNLLLDYLYIEAALISGDSARALHQIKKVYKEPRHQRDLLAWLDLKSQERFVTVEVLSHYAEMALDQQMFEKAVDIFKQVLSLAPYEVHVVKELLAGHLKDPTVKRFHDELSDSNAESAHTSDGFSIEHFGASDFHLERHSRGDASAAPHEETKPEPAAETPKVPGEPPAAPAPTHGESATVILLGVSDIPDGDLRGEDTAPAENAAPEKRVDFDSRWRAFESGSLSNDEILDLAETAARLGRAKQLKTLLSLKPSTESQHVRRKYYLGEYYLLEDDPLSALVILKTVGLDTLGREERKSFLLKKAYCYQQLNRFDIAHSVYLKVFSENPGFTEAERMAKVALDRHLASSTSEPVLEKVSKLLPESEQEEVQK